MNKYAAMARRHWQTYRPMAYSQIPSAERDSFFSTLGQQAALEVQALADELAGPDRPGEGYLEKLGRLNAALMAAEERVLPEQVLAPVEEENPDSDPDLDVNLDSEQPDPAAPGAGWVPVREDLTHPWWQAAADEADERDRPTPA